jgi:phosphate acetyltransferase
MGMELINQIKENAKSKNKTIILPESHDERVLKAAEILTKEQIAKIVTLGNPNKVLIDAEKI